MKKIFQKFLFGWRKTHRRGVLILILLMITTQTIYFFVQRQPSVELFSNQELINFQKQIDSLKADALLQKRLKPFNPNYMTDYKASYLGLNYEQVKRIEQFRETGNFINSIEDFRKITQISEEHLDSIKGYFIFPKTVRKVKISSEIEEKSIKEKIDLNTATEQQLQKIYGIGEKLSQRIIKYRERLQGFSFVEQINEIYGLDEVVIERIWRQFAIKTMPQIKKININTATKKELASLPYVSYKQAEEIVVYRSNVLNINSLSELVEASIFTADEIKKNELYLSVEN